MGLEGILFHFLYLETVSLELFSDPDQSIRLLSLPVDAAPDYKEKDP